MRTVLPACAAILAAPLLLANDYPSEGEGSYEFEQAPLLVSPEATAGLETTAICTDTWQQVREERELPPVPNEPADPDQPILFRAVVHQIDGCDFLLVGDGDVRPLPAPQEGPLRPQRAQ